MWRMDIRYKIAMKEPHEVHQVPFGKFEGTIFQKSIQEKWNKYLTSFDSTVPQFKFPEHPGRYAHNLSSIMLSKLQVEASFLGTKLCNSLLKSHLIGIETQFEKFMNQLHELAPVPSVIDSKRH